ncbi:hypothetical protein FN846DRAFT_94221 [Sphaerosporella brunnea]|uniref:Uncharacterized protein n=1 Tax=Sphaerosporella brunnea TaxID=1250544 RepID=A0A5J5ESR9_9PEZI|nr:hypothetical protein FN846DRAFT_94221 [Sphaerosporella brunnea]
MSKLRPSMSIIAIHQMSPEFTIQPPSVEQQSPILRPPPHRSPDIQHKCFQYANATMVTVIGISGKRTFELCSSCPAGTVFIKMCAIISCDQKECWIPASIIDIATVGFGGQYLGRRFHIYVPNPAKPARHFWWRRTRGGEPDVESKHDTGMDIQLLAEVLLQMAGELRTIELRLLRDRGEVHMYRIVAVMIVTAILLSAVACAWLKGASAGIAVGSGWFQSILLNLVSSVIFGGVAWTFWRPRDE